MASLLLLRPRTPQPLQACLAINAWSTVLCTVVVPLCILYQIEQRKRQRFFGGTEAPSGGAFSRQGVQPAAAQPAPAAGARLGRNGAAARDQALAHALSGQPKAAFPITGMWLLDVFYFSCMIWCIAAALFAVPG